MAEPGSTKKATVRWTKQIDLDKSTSITVLFFDMYLIQKCVDGDNLGLK